MSVPPKQRWFEDFTVGEQFEFGSHAVTEEEIVDYARRYDPQPFHLDAAAGAQTHFGGLVASGWMTAAVLMRLLCDHFIAPESSMGSPGLDLLRWRIPVRPGDRLSARVSVLEVRPSRSKPGRGSVRFRQEAVNQAGEVVMTIESWGMLRCRPTLPAAAPASAAA